jgi:hypothetical protein
MTDHPHTPPNNPGGNPQRDTTHPRHSASPAKRRARVRGCGIPATVWFTPHPEDSVTETRSGAHQHEPHPWTLTEIIRQFIRPGQAYTIAHIADGTETTVTRHQGEPMPESHDGADSETGKNDGSDALVAVVPMESGVDDSGERPLTRGVLRDAFAAGLTQHIDFAHGALRDGGTLAVQIPRPAPGPGFRDDTGHTIKTARDKGFAYLQHIVLVDALIDDEGITPALPQADLDTFWAARAQGLRVHARSHSDLLIFRKTGKADPLD